ncbi:hypothetical protein FH972_023260 [Carpinus fangiana]|uniref:Dienelactone hydrolase domain-containing protein n=1 Tax=Carpinus fangiana TaxID=176857 RepID=A0A5N6KWY1_9ROSI|nr:hypothetical protein FH972_023260 [Carpinus fangiana]
MASNPPGRCCTVGVKHEGEAVGEITQVANNPAYVSYPKDKSTANAVLILPDVIGHEFINVQLIADQFAANGYFVVIPDLFRGDPVPLNRPEGFDIMKWLQGPPGHLPDTVDPIIIATIKELREKHGVKKIGAVGYCFGGKYVARFLGATGVEAGATVDVGFTAHPSFVDEAELSAINGPLSIAAAETDSIFPAEKRHKSEEILAKIGKEKKIPYQVFLYSAVEHGFAVRADLTDKRIKYAKEQAFSQAVAWFDEFLKD